MSAGFRNWMLRPLHRVIWNAPLRRARKLMEFAEIEASGGRDLVRASELTSDPRLRKLYLAHAADEAHHARIFRARALALSARAQASDAAAWLAPGERGLAGLDVEAENDRSLLAFVHLSEHAAARDFAAYSRVLHHDPETRAIFGRVLRDEEFHMRYSFAELQRLAGPTSRSAIWKARLRRLWQAYLRLAMAFADLISTGLLIIQYFVLLPPFALMARRVAAREPQGWQDLGRYYGKGAQTEAER